jgi:hypothetical protein
MWFNFFAALDRIQQCGWFRKRNYWKSELNLTYNKHLGIKKSLISSCNSENDSHYGREVLTHLGSGIQILRVQRILSRAIKLAIHICGLPIHKYNQILSENIWKNMCLQAGCQWLTPVILTTWEAEIGRIVFRGQPIQVILNTPSPKQPEQNGVEVWLKW